mgnify:CR=1|jgi:hypothetical protein
MQVCDIKDCVYKCSHLVQYSSSGQGDYSHTTAAYQTTIPQYTQAQVNQYYVQYQCYPPQPYQIIPDYYVQPVQATHAGFQQANPGAVHDAQWSGHGEPLDVPMTASEAPSR